MTPEERKALEDYWRMWRDFDPRETLERLHAQNSAEALLDSMGIEWREDV